MADKQSASGFGTQFRGYRKEAVNRYIEQRAQEFARIEDGLRTENQQLSADLTALSSENRRLSDMLAESDKVIMQQKEELAALTEQLADSTAALRELATQVECLEARINTATAPEAPTVRETPPTPRPSVQIPPQKPIKLENSESTDKDDESLSAALKTIKNKLLKFLK